MNKHVFVLIAMTLFFAALIARAEQDSIHSEMSGRISSAVSVFPSDQSGFWIGEATIKDIFTGDVLGTPKVIVKAGKEARVHTVIEPGGDADASYALDMRFLVNPGGEAAEYGLTVSMGDDIVSEQAASLRLE